MKLKRYLLSAGYAYGFEHTFWTASGAMKAYKTYKALPGTSRVKVGLYVWRMGDWHQYYPQ